MFRGPSASPLFLLASHKGPCGAGVGAPRPYKGPKPHLILSCPAHSTALAAAGAGVGPMGRDTGPEMPPTHLCLTGHGSHPLFPLPTLSSPCSRLDSRLEGTGRKAGGGGAEPTTLSKWAPAHPSHPGIYRSNEYAVQRLYRRDPGGPGSLWSHLGWAGVTAQTHTLPPYASISPFLTSGTNSKELALPTPTPTPLLLPTPKVLVPSCFCSHTTSGQLCWFCSMFPFLDICYCCCDQLQMFILIASFGSAHVPLLQDAQGKVVWVTDHPSPCP